MPDGITPENRGQARKDLRDALRAIDQLPCADVADTSLGGRTFTPGVYCLSSADVAGELALSGGGDANSRFIFRINGTFNMADGANIRLADGARATNVYIIAKEDVTLGNQSLANANIISRGTVTIGSGSTVSGKTYGLDGDIGIESSNIGGGTGFIEICKVLSPGDPIPAGTIFTFTVSGVGLTFAWLYVSSLANASSMR